MKRIHVIIAGDVQGVGFRAWTLRRAQGLALVGWVKNREDGTVEVVAEGSKASLEAFIDLCRKGPEVSWVERVDAWWEEGTGEFKEFQVL